MPSTEKLHNFNKKPEHKQLVMNLHFRLAVEKQVKKFLEGDEASYEFPVFLTPAQRNFINEYSYSLGLKSRFSGKGKKILRNIDKILKIMKIPLPQDST